MAKETVHIEETLKASPEIIWSHVHEFARDWHPLIEWMELEPSTSGLPVRRFGVNGESKTYREQLTYFSHSERTMVYTALEGIEGVTSYVATLTVKENQSGKTTIGWHANIEAEPERAKEIAEGTGFVFTTGIDALTDLTTVHRTKSSSVVSHRTIESQMVKADSDLTISVSNRDSLQQDSICIFLHGIGGNRSNWHDQLANVSSEMPMVALDFRGYGDSTLGASQTRVDDYCKDILAVMFEFKASKVILCGLSYGSWIATSFALSYPDKISKLILCGGCTGMSEAAPKEREAFESSREVPLAAGQTPADFAPQVVEVISGPNAGDNVREQLQQSMARISVETYRDALHCFCNPESQFDFSKLSCPVLLMTGEHDVLAPPEEIARVANRMHTALQQKANKGYVQFEVIENAGHVCNLENPALVNQHLEEFICRT